MHTSILFSLWAVVSFILYKTYVYIVNERRHRANARRLHAQDAPKMRLDDMLSIDTIRKILKADNERRIPQFLVDRFQTARQRTDFRTGTFYQNILGSPGISTIDPKNVQAVLATQFKDFALGDMRNGSFYPLLERGIFASDGKQWEHSRALLRPQFARDQVSDLDLEEHHVQNMIRALPAKNDGWTDVTDLKPLFFRLTIDSATEFLFGKSVGSQLSALPGYVASGPSIGVSEIDFATSFDAAQALIARSARFADLYWLAQGADLKEHCRRCHRFIDFYVQRALAKRNNPQKAEDGGNEKPKYVFLDALAEATNDPVELRQQLLNILLAGRDTTASLLSFVFMSFDQQPHLYKKLRAIVLEEFGTYTNPKEITFSGLKSCTYLQWCMNETLRLYPIVPINGRRAVVDTTLPTGGGPDGTSPVYIRKGMQVDYSVYVMQRRKDLWGEDADEFRPERWDGRRPGWEYLPFNGGPRICIGQQFALTEAGYVIVRMLQRFEECVGVGNSWEPKEKGGLGWVRLWETLTMSPADGVKMRLREAKE